MGLLFPRAGWPPLSEPKKGDFRDAGWLCGCGSQLPGPVPTLEVKGEPEEVVGRLLPGSQEASCGAGPLGDAPQSPAHVPLSQSFSLPSLFPSHTKKSLGGIPSRSSNHSLKQLVTRPRVSQGASPTLSRLPSHLPSHLSSPVFQLCSLLLLFPPVSSLSHHPPTPLPPLLLSPPLPALGTGVR